MGGLTPGLLLVCFKRGYDFKGVHINMFKKVLFFILVIFFLAAPQVFPWGGVAVLSPTHQIILTEAYRILEQDPAFKESGFLPLESILSEEGVYALPDGKLDPLTAGYGPDVEGASPYQYHYYNPITKDGMADFAVNLFYKQLIDLKNSGDKSKPAAWSAHFLADMSVPYHIVGMTINEVLRYQKSNTQYLSEDITGPLELYDNNAAGKMPPAGWGEDHIFWFAMNNFIDDHAGGLTDWFDPWYSNGSGLRPSHEVATSSHVLWEGSAHRKYKKHPFKGIIPNEPGWYNPSWKNADPNFNFKISVATAQADNAALFAREVALYTRKNIQAIHLNPHLGIYHSIRNVATLWRASITGLKPSIHYAYANEQDEYPTLECRVRNGSDAIANNVRVKLFIQEKTTLIHQQVKSIGSVFPGGKGSAKFRLLLKPDTEYLVAMAVATKYDMPDLQYATVSGILKTKPVKIERPPVRIEPVDTNKIRKSWEGSWRIRSHHKSGKFKGRGSTNTLTISFNKKNIPTVTFAGKEAVKITNLSPMTITYTVTAGGNTVTTTLHKQKDGSIEGNFKGKNNASDEAIGGTYSSNF